MWDLLKEYDIGLEGGDGFVGIGAPGAVEGDNPEDASPGVRLGFSGLQFRLANPSKRT